MSLSVYYLTVLYNLTFGQLCEDVWKDDTHLAFHYMSQLAASTTLKPFSRLKPTFG